MALGTCVDLVSSKGTKVFVSETLPSAYTVAGYDALTWTEIGMIESVGEFGPDASIGSYTPIGTGVACKYMGTTDNGEISLTLAKTGDEGLGIIAENQGNVNSFAFKVELNDYGSTTQGHTTPAKCTRYMFPGLIRAAKISIGTGDDVVKITSAIVLNGEFVTGLPANSQA